VDPEDFRDPGADLVRSRVAATTGAGAIVSLHLGHLGTAEALPAILGDLTARGLRAVTLSTLLRD
jgi:peptidoglycan/xylan/chitin deacetylase (PgdA/CDA1 family)